MLTCTSSVSGPRTPTLADIEGLRHVRLQEFTKENDNDLFQRLWDTPNVPDGRASSERQAKIKQLLTGLDHKLSAQ